jgi:hypothetical protein
MQTHPRAILASILLLATAIAAAQGPSRVLSADDVKKAVPSEYFFRGQKAPVQLRNAVGFQLSEGKMVLAALVDASGYSTAIQQKYQGLLITETKLDIGGTNLPPGQYGFGFIANNKFVVMDVANNDVVSATYQTDDALQRAVPLKLVQDGAAFKLYAGKKWVEIKTE